MTHEQLVERVARVLRARYHGRDDWQICEERTKTVFRKDAAAALAAVYDAIKEPTPEMKGARKWGAVFPGEMSGNVNAEVWSAMLAASPLNPENKS